MKGIWSRDGVQEGKKLVEGLNRGKLAVALENIGQQAEAEKQWEKCQQLRQNHSLASNKHLVDSMLRYEKTALYIKAEDAVLRKHKK